MRCKVSKIEYVRNGIDSYCQSDINDIISNLEKAGTISNSLSCPGNFQYRNYVNSLHSIINGYVNDTYKIEELLKYVTKEFDDLNERLKNDVETLDSSLIKERESLVI